MCSVEYQEQSHRRLSNRQESLIFGQKCYRTVRDVPGGRGREWYEVGTTRGAQKLGMVRVSPGQGDLTKGVSVCMRRGSGGSSGISLQQNNFFLDLKKKRILMIEILDKGPFLSLDN